MTDVHIYPRPAYPAAKVCAGKQEWPGVIGEKGAVPQAEKHEGDRATPLGTFALGRIYVRPHLLGPLPARIASIAVPITRDLVWCDDPSSLYYNLPVNRARLPHGVSAEKMWRDDHLYNIVVEVQYNRPHPEPGKGSAIFLHVARNQERPEITPTSGCIALKQEHLMALLGWLSSKSRIHIHPLLEIS